MAAGAIPRRRLSMMAAVAATAPLTGRAASISAPDVVVYCDTTLVPAMSAVGAAFRGRTGVHVRVFGIAGVLALALIAHGVRNDALVTRSNWMDEGAARGLVNAATRVGDWRDPVVLAAKGGPELAALPSTDEISGLLAGSPLGVIDPTKPGGADGVALAGRLGWKVALSGAIDGPGVAFLVRHESARLGLLPRTAAVAEPKLSVIAAVPAALAPPVHYAAAESRNALSSNTLAFLEYLKTPAAAAMLRAAGLETGP